MTGVLTVSQVNLSAHPSGEPRGRQCSGLSATSDFMILLSRVSRVCENQKSVFFHASFSKATNKIIDEHDINLQTNLFLIQGIF